MESLPFIERVLGKDSAQVEAARESARNITTNPEFKRRLHAYISTLRAYEAMMVPVDAGEYGRRLSLYLIALFNEVNGQATRSAPSRTAALKYVLGDVGPAAYGRLGNNGQSLVCVDINRDLYGNLAGSANPDSRDDRSSHNPANLGPSKRKERSPSPSRDGDESSPQKRRRGSTHAIPCHTEATPAGTSTIHTHGALPPVPFTVTTLAESPNTIVLTDFARKAFSETGVRRHVLGVSVRGPKIAFCYYDRAGSVCSSWMHLVNDTADVVTALALIALGDREQLGFEPFIQAPVDAPMDSIKGCTVDLSGQKYVLDRVIHASYTLFGRDTTYHAAHPVQDPDVVMIGGDELAPPKEVMIRLSWQAARPSDEGAMSDDDEVEPDAEDDLFNDVNARGVEGVARLHSSHLVKRLSTSGVRARVGPGATATYKDRELQVLVFKDVCMPLHCIANMEDFKIAFQSLIQGLFLYIYSLRDPMLTYRSYFRAS